MSKRRTVCGFTPGWLTALLLAATFLLAPLATALADEGNPTPLDFKATGDALWDAYAVRLLLHFADPANPNPSQPQALPPPLDALPPELAADPRYAQLRFWEAGLKAWPPDPTAVSELAAAEKRAGGNAADRWLILNWQAGVLAMMADHSWYSDESVRTAIERAVAFNLDEAALRQQFRQGLDEFVVAYPDLSCGWYALGLNSAAEGQIVNGLTDFDHGNHAKRNGVPWASQLVSCWSTTRAG